MRHIRQRYIDLSSFGFCARALWEVWVSALKSSLLMFTAGDVPRELWGFGKLEGCSWDLADILRHFELHQGMFSCFFVCVLTYLSLLSSQWAIWRGKGEYCSKILWGTDIKQAKKSICSKPEYPACLMFSIIFAFTFVIWTKVATTKRWF